LILDIFPFQDPLEMGGTSIGLRLEDWRGFSACGFRGGKDSPGRAVGPFGRIEQGDANRRDDKKQAQELEPSVPSVPPGS